MWLVFLRGDDVSRDGSNWMAVDWSEGRLRIWVIGADGEVAAREEADVGGETGYEAVLGPLIAHHLDDDSETDILIAGDPAGPEGWRAPELRAVPCRPPEAGDVTPVEARDGRMRVSLVTGIRQETPAGLMLSDAVRVRGFLALNDTFDGVLCLTGMRTRWVHISAGEIVSFQSHLTGDLVRQTLAGLGVSGQPGQGMGEAVSDALSRPESLAARLGSIEAAHRLGRAPEADVLNEVWGLFLGLELAGARPYWLGQRVALVGSGTRMEAYRSAMSAQGVLLETGEEEDTILAGFRAIRG